MHTARCGSTVDLIVIKTEIRPLQLNSLFPVAGAGRSGRAASIIIHVIHSLLACNTTIITNNERVMRHDAGG